MKRHNAIIAILLILCLMPVPVHGTSFLTPISETLNSKETLKVDNSSYYSFDSKDGFFTGEPILVKVANGIFALHKLCVYGMIRILSWSFNFSAMDWFGDILDDTMKPLKLVLYDSFFNVVVAGLFTWLLLMFGLMKRKTKFWSSFMASIIIVAVGMGFLSSPSYYLRLADDVVQSITDDIVNEVFVKNKDVTATTVNGAVGNIAEMLWVVFVEDNWKYINFGSISEADEYSEDFLKALPRSKERLDLIKDTAKENIFIEGEQDGWRIGQVLGTSLLSAVPMLVLTLLSLIAMGSKIIAAIYALWAPVIFILAILPMFGLRTFLRWFQKEGGFLGIFILVFLMITLLLIFFNEINKKTDGIMDAMLIINAIIITLIIFRRHLLDFLVSAQYGDKGVKRGMKGSEGRNSIGYRAIDSASNKMQNAGGMVLNGVHSTGNKALGMINDYVAKPIVNAAEGTAKAAAGGIAGGFEASREGLSNMREHKEQRAAAEEYLRKAYDKERHSAEEDVEPDDLGIIPRPEYSEYVEGKMKNESLGMNLFTNKEINDVVMQLNQIEKNGGTKEDLFKTLDDKPEVHEEAERPRYSDAELEKWREEQNIEILGLDDDTPSGNSADTSDEFKDLDEGKYTENYIINQYQTQKREAEEKAHIEGIRIGQVVNPVYNSFTQKVMEREAANVERFDSMDYKRAHEEMIEIRRKTIKGDKNLNTEKVNFRIPNSNAGSENYKESQQNPARSDMNFKEPEPRTPRSDTNSKEPELKIPRSDETSGYEPMGEGIPPNTSRAENDNQINEKIGDGFRSNTNSKEPEPRTPRSDETSGYEPMGEGIPPNTSSVENDNTINEQIIDGFRSDMISHQQHQTDQVKEILETDLHERTQIDEIHEKLDIVQKETERIQQVVKNSESSNENKTPISTPTPSSTPKVKVKVPPIRKSEIPNYNSEES